MMDKIKAVFSEALGIVPGRIEEDSSPDTIREWDSLAAMRLVAGVEEAFGVELSTREILSMRTVAMVRSVLRKKGVKNV
ncbi:MAG: acyl carrier protein [Methylobacteriaceae bacterium]|nr:acyl carrier protein [Methylobacteriaceae bacterium]